jgi:hypothetical protein
MTSNSGAKRLLEEFEQGGGFLILSALSIQAGDTSLTGSGKLLHSNESFLLTARFELGSVPGDFARSNVDGMREPHLYSRDQFWKIRATTFGGVEFEGAVAPPHGWRDRADGVTEIDCDIDQINLEGETDTDFLIALYQVLEGVDLTINQTFEVPLDSLNSTPSRFHAILPGVNCLLAEHRTRVERHNAFFQATASERLDTFVDVNDERRIGLVEEDDGLHVHLELPPGDRSEEVEKAIFSALLNAVAFTHGCQPIPCFKEYRRAGRVVLREVRPVTTLKMATIKPIGSQARDRCMLGLAFDFFKRDQAIVPRIQKAMWLYRDAAAEAVPLPVQLLTACTLFEGLVQALFDAHNLKGLTSSSENSIAFRNAKKATISCLEGQHVKTGFGLDAESPWRRFAGYLKNAGYVRPKERTMAVAEFFGFPWAGDVEEIFTIWNRHRNGLAHGAEVKGDFDSIKGQFQAWSRLSGAIHRFILAEMGFVGRFIYSPMEPGLEEMDLKPKSAASFSAVGPEEISS